MKMADTDINPFSDHKTDALLDKTGKTIPLSPEGVGEGATWDIECKQEISFTGKTQRTRLKEAQVEELY